MSKITGHSCKVLFILLRIILLQLQKCDVDDFITHESNLLIKSILRKDILKMLFQNEGNKYFLTQQDMTNSLYQMIFKHNNNHIYRNELKNTLLEHISNYIKIFPVKNVSYYEQLSSNHKIEELRIKLETFLEGYHINSSEKIMLNEKREKSKNFHENEDRMIQETFKIEELLQFKIEDSENKQKSSQYLEKDNTISKNIKYPSIINRKSIRKNITDVNNQISIDYFTSQDYTLIEGNESVEYYIKLEEFMKYTRNFILLLKD